MSEKKPPSNVPKTADYEVGYRKPPKKSQFKKGQSGCSQGRPRKTPAMKFDPVFDGYFGDVVLREAMRPVTMRENGQTIEISTLAAIVRAQNVAAIKGNQKAQASSIGLVKTVQDRVLDGRREFYQATVAYKERCRQTMAKCDRYHSQHPEFLPHPDDIVIDERTQDVRFNGPQTSDELAEWKTMQARGVALKLQRDALIAELAGNPRRRAEIEGELARLDALLIATHRAYPEERVRRQPGFDLMESRRAMPARFRRLTGRA